LPDSFPIKNGLKQGDALSPLLFNFALKYAIRRWEGKHKGISSIPKVVIVTSATSFTFRLRGLVLQVNPVQLLQLLPT
jgi:hypothetical protein